MALNFRMAYTDSIRYIDLFPDTTLEAITDKGDNLYQITVLPVTIPAVSNETQNIAIVADSALVNSVVKMYLISTGEQAQEDYNTITQFSVNVNQLTITRLYEYPTDSIDVNLVFYKKVVG